MSNENTQLAIPDNLKTLAVQLNQTVMGAINSEAISGFEKAFTVSTAIGKLKAALTDEYMAPIMALQSNRLGFKTDKDKDGGYPMATVKNCLIEAVLMGLQPYGNEFNIIAGNTYATKEGLGAILKKFNGLSYEIVPMGVNMKLTPDSAEATMKLKWMLHGAPQERELKFVVKTNAYATADAVIGKATRKCRKWLHDTISGFEIPEGEVGDIVTTNAAPVDEITLEDLEALYELKESALTKGEKTTADRVITNKETQNYIKLRDLLKSK